MTWNGMVASWTGVSNATSYTVKLLNGTTVVDTKTGLTLTSYDFTSEMNVSSTSWTFKVQAIGNGNYASSEEV